MDCIARAPRLRAAGNSEGTGGARDPAPEAAGSRERQAEAAATSIGPLARLPQELVERIVDHLDDRDIGIAQTSRAFAGAVRAGPPAMFKPAIDRANYFGREAVMRQALTSVAARRAWASLTRLGLCCLTVTADDLRAVARVCPDLQDLRLRRLPHAAELSRFGKLRSFFAVEIGCESWSWDMEPQTAQAQKNTTGPGSTDDACRALRMQLPQLEDLELGDMSWAGDAAYEQLACLTAITSLNLGSNHEFSGRACARILTLPRLQRLTFDHSPSLEAGSEKFGGLAPATALVSLRCADPLPAFLWRYLAGCPAIGEVRSASLHEIQLPRMFQLRHLELASQDADTETVASLAAFPNLRELRLADCCDDGWAGNYDPDDLEQCPLTVDDVHRLAALCPRLEHLSLERPARQVWLVVPEVLRRLSSFTVMGPAEELQRIAIVALSERSAVTSRWGKGQCKVWALGSQRTIRWDDVPPSVRLEGRP